MSGDLAMLRWDLRVGLQEPEQTESAIADAGGDGSAGGGISGDIAAVQFRKGEAERTRVDVDVGFVIGERRHAESADQRVKVSWFVAPARFELQWTGQTPRGQIVEVAEVVAAVIVRRRLCQWGRVRGIGGQAETVGVGGESVVACPGAAGEELLSLVVEVDLAGVGFVEFVAGFASQSEVGTRSGKEIAFIGGVEEDLRVDGDVLLLRAENVDCSQTVFAGGGGVQSVTGEEGDLRLCLEHVVKDGFGDRGFEVIAVLAEGDVCGVRGVAVAVVLVDALCEFLKQAADQVAAFDVAFAQTAGGHAAEMGLGFDQEDTTSEAGGCDGRGDAAGGTSENGDVGLQRVAHGCCSCVQTVRPVRSRGLGLRKRLISNASDMKVRLTNRPTQ